jgi:ligand-binding SRPBCC domain-containing protein
LSALSILLATGNWKLIMPTRVFEHRSVIPTTLAQMLAFHQHPRAIYRLTPPPIFVQCLRDGRTSLTSGELDFRLWFGPLPVRWLARHEPGPVETSFIDRMMRGPLESWEHQHIFRDVPGGVELLDRVIFAHKPGLPGLLTRLVFDGLPLRTLFLYRHLRTRLGINRQPER